MQHGKRPPQRFIKLPEAMLQEQDLLLMLVGRLDRMVVVLPHPKVTYQMLSLKK
jgi:hypothetical protein